MSDEIDFEKIYWNCIEAVATWIAEGRDPEDGLVVTLLDAADAAKAKMVKKT